MKKLKDLDLKERLDLHSELKESGCIEWSGYILETGYGQIRYKGKRMGAHRAAWIANYGEIPTNQFVLHKCDNRCCINPSHLFLGTQQDNMDDMIIKGRDVKVGRKGVKNSNSKLTDDDVLAMRQMFLKGIDREILRGRFGVSKTTVQSILSNKAWKHVELGDRTSSLCNEGYAKKLSYEDVAYIRKWHMFKKMTRLDIAQKFNITVSNVDLITANKIWSE